MNIESILKRLNIDAKRRGSKWQGSCPNPEHNDRSPSWFIRDEPGTERHGYHRCSACGFAGGMIGLVMLVQGCDGRTAHSWIGGDSDAVIKPIPKAVNVSVMPTSFHEFVLPEGVQFTGVENWPVHARAYAEKRNITNQVERWGIGYAVVGILEGRVVIPYRDIHGVPRGYTSRTYIDSRRRYKEPSENECANRSAMFGEQHWLHEYTDDETVIVTEGALNALAVERALSGERYYPAVAATAGSSLRPAHAVKLSKFSNVICLTDPDRPGDKMAHELHQALARHCEFRRLRLAVGTDPDSIPKEILRKALLPLLS